VIPRLYIAGEIMGGVHGSRYYGGTAVGKAFTFGYLAGINAAAEKI
jgi:succinate dehydrogenase/fumarate reductase flavoprotein subunit